MKKQSVQVSDIGSNKSSEKAKPEIPAVGNVECNRSSKKQSVQDSDIGSNKTYKRVKPEVPVVFVDCNVECNLNLGDNGRVGRVGHWIFVKLIEAE